MWRSHDCLPPERWSVYGRLHLYAPGPPRGIRNKPTRCPSFCYPWDTDMFVLFIPKHTNRQTSQIFWNSHIMFVWSLSLIESYHGILCLEWENPRQRLQTNATQDCPWKTSVCAQIMLGWGNGREIEYVSPWHICSKTSKVTSKGMGINF